MTHSHVHLNTQVIDDQPLSHSRHMAWCGCHEIFIQPSFNVLFLTHFFQLSLHSPLRPLFRKLKNSSTKCQSLWKTQVNHPSFNNLTVSSVHLLRLFAVMSIHLFIAISRVHSFTMHAVSLSVLSKTQLQKAFSPNAGALSL